MTESIYIIYLTNVAYKDDFKNLVEHWYDVREMKMIILGFEAAKIYSILFFVNL